MARPPKAGCRFGSALECAQYGLAWAAQAARRNDGDIAIVRCKAR